MALTARERNESAATACGSAGPGDSTCCAVAERTQPRRIFSKVDQLLDRHRRQLAPSLEAGPDRRKAAAVQRSRPQPLQALMMLGRAIALVALPAVARMLPRMFGHNFVARDFRDDRSRRDRPAFC